MENKLVCIVPTCLGLDLTTMAVRNPETADASQVGFEMGCSGTSSPMRHTHDQIILWVRVEDSERTEHCAVHPEVLHDGLKNN